MDTPEVIGASLVAEIRDLAARRDINDAVQRYMRGLDRLDAELQRSAFHPAAWIDCGLMQGGVDEFVDFAQGLLATQDATHHLLGQVRIEMDGGDAASGRALGECYFQAWHRLIAEDGAVTDMFIAGRYLDVYTCIAGAWRIAERTLVTDWVRNDPGSLDFFAVNPAAPRGARGGADPSQTRSCP